MKMLLELIRDIVFMVLMFFFSVVGLFFMYGAVRYAWQVCFGVEKYDFFDTIGNLTAGDLLWADSDELKNAWRGVIAHFYNPVLAVSLVCYFLVFVPRLLGYGLPSHSVYFSSQLGWGMLATSAFWVGSLLMMLFKTGVAWAKTKLDKPSAERGFALVS
jgi:hypothetical protein